MVEWLRNQSRALSIVSIGRMAEKSIKRWYYHGRMAEKSIRDGRMAEKSIKSFINSINSKVR